MTLLLSTTTWKKVMVRWGVSLSCQVTNDRRRGNGLRLCQGRFRVDIKKISVMERIVKQWNGLPMEVVEALSLEVFEKNVWMCT